MIYWLCINYFLRIESKNLRTFVSDAAILILINRRFQPRRLVKWRQKKRSAGSRIFRRLHKAESRTPDFLIRIFSYGHVLHNKESAPLQVYGPELIRKLPGKILNTAFTVFDFPVIHFSTDNKVTNEINVTKFPVLLKKFFCCCRVLESFRPFRFRCCQLNWVKLAFVIKLNFLLLVIITVISLFLVEKFHCKIYNFFTNLISKLSTVFIKKIKLKFT